MTTLVEYLRSTRSRLLKDNWGQGSYYDNETGCFCLAGAVRVGVFPDTFRGWSINVVEGEEAREPVLQPVFKALVDEIPDGWKVEHGILTTSGTWATDGKTTEEGDLAPEHREHYAESVIIGWNDKTHRTKAEVIALVDKAIERASK